MQWRLQSSVMTEFGPITWPYDTSTSLWLREAEKADVMVAKLILPLGKYQCSCQDNTGKPETQLSVRTLMMDCSFKSFCSQYSTGQSTRVRQYKWFCSFQIIIWSVYRHRMRFTYMNAAFLKSVQPNERIHTTLQNFCYFGRVFLLLP